jgi:DNA helicase-2/ATP-dependent DNA helicase PcrA
VVAARDEPSLERFLPMRGEGVLLSASDIDTYRSCPLKYKFARVFRIPQEPTLHQRFGIAVHHVLERYHGALSKPAGSPDRSPSCSDCLMRPGGVKGSATPTRSASCAARRLPRSRATTSIR